MPVRLSDESMSNDTLILNVFGRLRGRLETMAQRITGNTSDADDVLQDAFVNLWQRRYSINNQQAAEGMSVITVRNASIDAVRRARVRQASSIDDVQVAADEPSTNASMQVYQQVQEIIEKELSPEQRAIVQLHEIEGKSHDEIATQLDLTPVNVRVQLSRARKKIREIYRKRYNDE